MWQRHYGTNDSSYRGTPVDPAWRDFRAFLSDLGDRPTGTTLDRIDNAKGYEPGNCRWATPTEQARNRTSAKLEPHEPTQIRWLVTEGQRPSVVARFFGISQQHVFAITARRIWK